MTKRTLPVTVVVAAGIGLGFAADHLLRTAGGPGLNFFLLFAGLAASVWLVTSSGGSPPGREASLWLGVGVLCGAALLWRGSELVRIGTLLAACTAFAIPALEAGRGWTRKTGTLDVIEAAASAGLHAVFGGVRLLNRGAWAEVGTFEARGASATAARSLVGGVLLALVPLVVFGALFMSADRMFATLVGDFVRIDLELVASHLVGIGVLSWLACGYLVGFCSGTRLDGVRQYAPVPPTLGVGPVATALALVDLLFLVFVIVQFRYLFGGSAWVDVTPGLTYAEYARAGFFQLVTAVALAIPWLLGTHALLRDEGIRSRAAFAALSGVHLLLLLVIVVSAVQRMVVYQDAYGLTELRVVATAGLVALGVIVLWFGATVLSGRRERFAIGGLATAFALVGALQLLDPAGLVARHNLDRMEELGGVDTSYLASLGSDAAPDLLARIGDLPPAAACPLARRLLGRWGPERPAEWKSYNWSESRARAAVGDRLDVLRYLSAAEDCEGAADGGGSAEDRPPELRSEP